MKYGKEALDVTLKHFTSFFVGWEVAMRKLDALILRRTVLIKLNTEALLAESKGYRIEGEDLNQETVSQIIAQSSFPSTGLSLALEMTMRNCVLKEPVIDLVFHENVYDLLVAGKLFKTSFYGPEYILTKEEITVMVEKLGLNMIAKLEENLGAE